MKQNAVYFPVILAFFIFTVILALVVGENGFWRHDAWGYGDGRMVEFTENGRWLAPVLYSYLKYLPYYLAWLLSMTMAWGYGYIFVKRFLDGSKIENKALIYSLPFLFVLHPGYIDQLGWPIHTLAAVHILFVFALLSKGKESLLLSGAATVLVFAVLQTFSFLAVLIAIPSYKKFSDMNAYRVVKVFIGLLVFWALCILFSWAVSKSIQYLYLGEFPGLPAWRDADPAKSPSDLYDNVLENITLFGDHLTFVYSTAVLLVMLAIAVVLAVFLYARKRTQELAIYSSLILFSACFFVSVYVFTAPLGTAISTRTTFTFGMAFILLIMALYVATSALDAKRNWGPLVIVSAILIVSAKPMYLSYVNAKWFSAFTSDFKAALQEIEDEKPDNLNGVIVDRSEFQEGAEWPLDYSHIRPEAYTFTEGLNEGFRLIRAFDEMGYENVIWCGGDAERVKECEPVERGLTYEKCSSINPEVCSAGITDSGYWAIKF